jgi:hypothetical protein
MTTSLLDCSNGIQSAIPDIIKKIDNCKNHGRWDSRLNTKRIDALLVLRDNLLWISDYYKGTPPIGVTLSVTEMALLIQAGVIS